LARGPCWRASSRGRTSSIPTAVLSARPGTTNSVSAGLEKSRYRRRGDERPRGRDEAKTVESIYAGVIAVIVALLVAATFATESHTDALAAHAKVRRATRPTIDAEWLDERIDALDQLATQGDTLAAEELLLQMVRAPRRAGSVAPTAPRVAQARTR